MAALSLSLNVAVHDFPCAVNEDDDVTVWDMEVVVLIVIIVDTVRLMARDGELAALDDIDVDSVTLLLQVVEMLEENENDWESDRLPENSFVLVAV